MRTPNESYEVATGTTCIQLQQGKFVLIDTSDLPKVANYRWSAVHKRNTWYAYSTVVRPNGHCTSMKMHRLIIEADGLQVDHINGNGLDNRRENLRAVTVRENAQNRHHPRTSQYPGVYWDKCNQRWRAQIQVNNKMFALGTFNDERRASRAYAKAILILEASHHAGATPSARLPTFRESSSAQLALF